MNNDYCEHISGAYDRCLECSYLGNGCDGPRTSAMTIERWCHWCRQLKSKRGFTNAYLAEITSLGEATIERIMSGKISQDIMRSTVQLLEDFLVGSSGSWPCAMELNKDKDVVYEDRPETLEALREKVIQVDNLRRHLDDFKGIMDREVEAVREKMQREVDFLKDQVRKKDEQIARKDTYIDTLIEAVRNGGKL